MDSLEIIHDIFWFEFEDERLDILTNFHESFQVQACPWSWKTTLLVAKLMLLAQTIDFSQESVCVLTHTNVAVEEIRKKIDKCNKLWYEKFINNVNKLFSYPNFIWTTQSFLDRYLWIPWYIKKYWRKPVFIWDEFIDTNFLWVNYNILTNDLEVPSNKNYLTRKAETKRKVLYVKRNIQIIIERKLSYKEIDYFSDYYLENTSSIKKLLQKRFNYVFLDEIQDTNSLHIDILNKLFEWGNNVIQWFWDYNQEILEDWEKNDFTVFWTWEIKNIDNSMRLSSIIANKVKNVCIEPQNLQWIERIDIPIYFIIFDEDRILDVIPEYERIIKLHSYEWIQREDLLFKAVWWVKKDENQSNLYIWKYWEKFNNWKIKKSKVNLFSYFQKIDNKEFEKEWYRKYKNTIIDWIIHVFNQKENQIKQENWKWFSKVTLIKYLTEKDLISEFNLNIYKWANNIINDALDWNKVKEYILWLDINWKHVKDSSFLNNDIFWTPEEISELSSNNIYCENSQEIIFSTIHNVKWETHTWTLLLDTDFHEQNNGKIIEFWNNVRSKKSLRVRNKKWLKMNYVWLTRATHLLCVAIKKDNLKCEMLEESEYIKIIEL